MIGAVMVLTMLAVAVGGAIFIFWAAYLAGLQGTYAQVAAQWGGRALPRAALRYPRATVPYEGLEATLGSSAADGGFVARSTELAIPWHDASFSCRIAPATALDRLGRAIADLAIGSHKQTLPGDARFRRHWTVQANQREALVRVLSPAVISQLDYLQWDTRGGRLEVVINQGFLRVRRSGVLNEHSTLTRFVVSALQLYEQASLSWTAQIEMVEGPPSEPTEIICKICGEPVLENAVACRACGTPHHKDCWQYSGACSVYGCGHTRYRRIPPSPGKLHAT